MSDLSRSFKRQIAAGDDEARSLKAELLALRKALVAWDFAVKPPNGPGVRDQIADYIEKKYGDDQPYATADQCIWLTDQRWDEIDAILFAVIPEDHWGLR